MYIFPPTVCVYLYSIFFLVGAATSRKTFVFLKQGRFSRSRSSKVDLCATYPTPIQPQFWGCSRCTRLPMLGVSQHMDPKLFGREIIFEEFQRI